MKLHQLLWVAEDVEWLRDEWWLRGSESLSDGHIRRGASTIGRLLLDGDLQRAWNHYGLPGEPRITGPDLSALVMREGLRLEHAGALIAGGGREAGQYLAFVGSFRVANPRTGVPADAHSGFAVRQTAITRDAQRPLIPGELQKIVEKPVPLSEYVDAPSVARKGEINSRRDVIEYFRGYPGGPDRPSPSVDGRRRTAAEVEPGQSIEDLMGHVHTYLRDGTYFELLSIGQAIGRSDDTSVLIGRIRAEERERQKRRPKYTQHETPAGPGEPILFLRQPSRGADVDPEAALYESLLGIMSLEVPLYRTVRLKWFRTMLSTRTVHLVPPSKWADPFENLLGRADIVRDDGNLTPLADFRSPTYGQCWSLVPESDAIWRIYSTVIKDPATGINTAVEEEGVKVRTTAGRLLRILWNACPGVPADSCFLGIVRYMPQSVAVDQIARMLTQPLGRDVQRGRTIAESLLIKREPFGFEREVRLLYVDEEGRFDPGLPFPIKIDPNGLFDEVVLDPRLRPEDCSSRVAELQTYGFSGPIGQSTLYQPVRLEIKIEGEPSDQS